MQNLKIRIIGQFQCNLKDVSKIISFMCKVSVKFATDVFYLTHMCPSPSSTGGGDRYAYVGRFWWCVLPCSVGRKASCVISDTGNRTPVSRVTGGDTSHYTMSDSVCHVDSIIRCPNPCTYNTTGFGYLSSPFILQLS